MAFTPVKQNRISTEIVTQLKESILSGRYPPGRRMPTERELTEQFRASRVVVREALRELEIKGLVKILQGPAGGAYVTDLSFDHLNNAFLDLFLYNKLSVTELIRTRILIECEIARLAAARADAKAARRLEAALAGEGSGGLPHPELVSARLVVHQVLAELSGNRLLQAIAGSLFRLTGEVILEVKPVHEVIHRPAEHTAIVRAVLTGNGEAAAAAMERHLRVMGNKLVKLEGIYRRRRGLKAESAAARRSYREPGS
jgi:GntR family transcriptional repressor for pyruvate dehydrogenase complex